MNTFGENIRLTIFGESHGEAIGMVLDGFPAGEDVDIAEVKKQLARRAPGGETATPRKELRLRTCFQRPSALCTQNQVVWSLPEVLLLLLLE